MAVAAASAPLDLAAPHGSNQTYPGENKGSVSYSIKEIASGHQIINGKNENLLIVSPYEEEPHLLDLRTLDSANQILAQALTGLKCLRSDYATAPYVEIFNWTEVIESVRQQVATSDFDWKENSFYIVVFRSQIPPTTVYADLGVLDKAAHAEATKSGGFLKYWFGSPDASGRNLATCVWRNLHDARVGSVGEAHRKAGGAARQLYTEWKIERLRLLIKDDAKEWEISQWVD
ncbi:UPF0643 protein [Lachnellula hyalina]|uniref:UPF0643 protein n=1 Tax=Lachnellula hyalina TaxID=1316788 RepID=A0A8H8TXR0_9HELO|nr:UPF0643 protein [Lachnellula hyalina]TVY25797.1 UPF0643 protein [Lachnellula hyalina]